MCRLRRPWLRRQRDVSGRGRGQNCADRRYSPRLSGSQKRHERGSDGPVVREAMTEWMHAAVHLNGNHMLTRELFRQAESKDRRWTLAKLKGPSRWPAWGSLGQLNAAAVPSSTLRIHPSTRAAMWSFLAKATPRKASPRAGRQKCCAEYALGDAH